MNYQKIIDEYYPENDDLRALLLKHSRQVAGKCLSVSDRHPELALDKGFLEEAAMLHDIGIRWCHAPSIFCYGNEPYIRHGLIGGQLLRSKGFERHARVCERHTGTGLTKEMIEAQRLPLPAEDFCPETIEEQLVCYADLFFSKSHPESVSSVDDVERGIKRYGDDGVLIFREWVKIFE